MSFFTDFFEESFGDVFNQKTAKDPESFHMSIRLPSISIIKKTIEIGYINSYYCKYIRDIGSYFIIINSKFSNAIFAISKTNKTDKGIVNKIVSSGDDINITWDELEYPYLQYIINNNNNVYDKTKRLDFYIKVITSF
jgi:hypothetical protein